MEHRLRPQLRDGDLALRQKQRIDWLVGVPRRPVRQQTGLCDFEKKPIYGDVVPFRHYTNIYLLKGSKPADDPNGWSTSMEGSYAK